MFYSLIETAKMHGLDSEAQWARAGRAWVKAGRYWIAYLTTVWPVIAALSYGTANIPDRPLGWPPEPDYYPVNAQSAASYNRLPAPPTY